MNLILASRSPRRRQLLALLGLDFSVQTAEVDERPRVGESPVEYVRRLARAKAMACPDGHGLVLAADTVVAVGADLLGKPRNMAEAGQMLRRLRGGLHQVYTALALRHDPQLWIEVCVTQVLMRDYDEAEIAAHVASGDPLDKAGAYAIQHPTFRPVAAVEGCYTCVVGLPLCHLVLLLRRAGQSWPEDVPARCQEAFGHSCEVFSSILAPESKADHANVSSTATACFDD